MRALICQNLGPADKLVWEDLPRREADYRANRRSQATAYDSWQASPWT